MAISRKIDGEAECFVGDDHIGRFGFSIVHAVDRKGKKASGFAWSIDGGEFPSGKNVEFKLDSGPAFTAIRRDQGAKFPISITGPFLGF